jgi:hypothetical protein
LLFWIRLPHPRRARTLASPQTTSTPHTSPPLHCTALHCSARVHSSITPLISYLACCSVPPILPQQHTHW